jgi:diguanylate cyclase (GGDEF)-like protein
LTDNQQGEPKTPDKQSIEDKRHVTYFPATHDSEEVTTTTRRFGAFFAAFRFGDILSSRFHTKDFKDGRADYIEARLRFMAIFFAVAVILYIPVDYLTLTEEHFMPIVIARCLLCLVHIIVCVITLRSLSIHAVNILLGVDIFAASLFYVASIYILQGGAGEIPPVGYAFMPFMVIVMLGLFPLTLVCSILIMMLVVGPYAGLQIWLDSMTSHELLDMLILFLLFMGIILWLQSGQLLMLLKLYRESTRDVLTGLINRRILMKFLEDEVNQTRDTGRRFSVLMLDLDRFKHINDDYGHMTGDMVLKATARLLENEMRLSDIVARFGGEEFVVVLPGLASDEAVAVAERICKGFNDIQVSAADGREVTFTCSIGVTEYSNGETIEKTLRRADDALYDAKEQGRNRVIYNPV